MQNTTVPQNPVLIVDDEPEITAGYELILNSAGIMNTITRNEGAEALALIVKQPVSVVLLDLNMPKMSGERVLEFISQKYPDIPVIIITGMNEIEAAVKCIKMGAYDYMVKPVEEQRVISSVRRAIERQEMKNEYQTFRQLVFNNNLNYPEAFAKIISRNKTMRSIFQYIEAIAKTNKPVLITGASGVGKGLIAESIYTVSGRVGEFVSVNIAGLDDNLFSDSLFGHKKGAFTGADTQRPGLIERAANGCLFLDEIGDLSPASQIKLLRLLEEGEYYPVGSDVPREANTRIIAATNKDINLLQKMGEFRTDLYYRLQTHHIHVPDLMERKDDLFLLIDHFLEEAARELDKKRPTPSKELYALLGSYYFPGNVRELQSMIYDSVSHHQSKMLSMDRFKEHIAKHSSTEVVEGKESSQELEASEFFSFFKNLPTLKVVRQLLIDEAVKRSDGNKAVAAQILGITRSGLAKLLKRSKQV